MKDNRDEIIRKTMQKDIKPSATLNQSVYEKAKEMQERKIRYTGMV